MADKLEVEVLPNGFIRIQSDRLTYGPNNQKTSWIVMEEREFIEIINKHLADQMPFNGRNVTDKIDA
jgi:hypothetical protein